jgi:hypothetical protein
MRSLKVDPATESLLRRQILEYFLEPCEVYMMKHDYPFENGLLAETYTWDQVRFVRRSLEVAGLLERVSGTTADVVLRTTGMGRQMLVNGLTEENHEQDDAV